MIYRACRPGIAADLFGSWKEGIIWSCLQGIMGRIYTDDPEKPGSAAAVLGEYAYLAGRPCPELLSFLESSHGKEIVYLVPVTKVWEEEILRHFGSRAEKVIRFAIKKEADFCRDALERAVSGLPEGYSLGLIDEKLFRECRTMDWCRDWTAYYSDYEMYRKWGLGVAAFRDGEPVSGAASYCGFQNGIEISVSTREDHRRKGLAYACSAKLILLCLERGWYPSWDAANRWSVGLAEKLGYHFDREYAAYRLP